MTRWSGGQARGVGIEWAGRVVSPPSTILSAGARRRSPRTIRTRDDAGKGDGGWAGVGREGRAEGDARDAG